MAAEVQGPTTSYLHGAIQPVRYAAAPALFCSLLLEPLLAPPALPLCFLCDALVPDLLLC
jgi:hypothetical protein